MYFNGGRSHWYEFCTFCTGYLWISLTRPVSVQVVFLSNPYEVNNTKNCINLIHAAHDAYFTSQIMSYWIVEYYGCAFNKIINDIVEYCYFFRKAFTRFDFTGDCQQTRVELCLYKWPWTLHSCGWSLYEWQTTRKRKPGLGLVPVSCVCEHTLRLVALAYSDWCSAGGTGPAWDWFDGTPGIEHLDTTITV